MRCIEDSNSDCQREVCRWKLMDPCSRADISTYPSEIFATWWLAGWQVGGFMRAEHAFRRVILRYSVNGQVESLTEEVYRPPGDRTPESPSASGGQ